MPTIKDICDGLTRFPRKVVVNIKSAFWHVPLNESQKEYFSFMTSKGAFRWTSVPFGFLNSLTNLQFTLNHQIKAPILNK